MEPPDFTSFWSGEDRYDNIEDICTFLGLKQDYARELKQHEETSILFHHWSIMHWIHKMLERNATDVQQSWDSLGFTQTRAQMLSDWSKYSPLSGHQTLLYFAKCYVQSAFGENDCEISSLCYPYDGSFGEIHYTEIEADEYRMEMNPNKVVTRKVPYMNLDGIKCMDLPQYQDSDFIVLYHGTDHQSARHIMENGIYLPYGQTDQDFSSGYGFYLTENPSFAQAWAKTKSFFSKCAVLSFRIPRDLLTECKGLVLDAEKDFAAWRDIVMNPHSLRKKHLVAKYSGDKEIDYVQGPISIHSSEIYDNSLTQICILSEKMCFALNDPGYIHMVYFG